MNRLTRLLNDERGQFIVPAVASSPWTMASTHPRLWLTPARVTALQTARTNNTVRWQDVLSSANTGLGVGTWTQENMFFLDALAAAYVAGAGNTYGDKAVAGALALAISSGTCPYAGETNGCHFSGGDYYEIRNMYRIGMVLDWCYTRFTAGQRQTVATWLMDRIDEVWHETNPARCGAYPNIVTCGNGLFDPANNYQTGFYIGAAAAAVAAYGDDTGSNAVSGSGPTGRATYHVNLLISKLTSLNTPNLDGGGIMAPFVTGPRPSTVLTSSVYAGWGEGGTWAEGTNYETSHFWGAAIDALYTGIGNDYLNDGGAIQNFFRDSQYWRIHSTTPALTHHYHLGDQPADAAGILRRIDRWRALVVATLLNNPTLRAQVYYWLNTITPDHGVDKLYDVWELLYYDVSQATSAYTSTFDTANYLAGPRILVNRSDWTSTATYFGIWSGALKESHQMQDVNGFLVYKGGWLVANANMYSNNGIEQQTDRHNNYTLDDVAVAISTSSVAAGTTITTSSAHGYAVRDFVKITGHTGSIPNINSDSSAANSGQIWRINTVPTTTSFTIDPTVTVGGTGGTATRTNIQVVEDKSDLVTPWPQDVGTMLKEETTSEFTLFEGQAKNAYVHDKSHTGFNRLTDYVRKFVYINSIDSFVIYDRLTNVTAALAKVFHIQSKNSATISTRQFTFTNGTYKACCDSLLPSADTTVTSAAWNMPSNSSYQTLITVNGNRATDYVLTTMQLVTDAASVPASAVVITEVNGRMDGAQIGTWVVLLGRTETVALAISYTTAATAIEHLVVDLQQSHTYTIATKDGSGSDVRSFSAASNSHGTLRFTAQSNERTFSVS